MKFTDKRHPNFVYEVVCEEWVNENLYAVIFNDMFDINGEKYTLVAVYHKDKDKITYTRAYKTGNADAEQYIPSDTKKEIDEYILRMCGAIDKNTHITTRDITITLKVAVSNDTSIGDYNNFFETAKTEIKDFAKTLYGKGINVIEVLDS